MTEEQTEYKTSPQCFGQFERDNLVCKMCGVAVECYEQCGAYELLSVAKLYAGLCRVCDNTEVDS